MEIFDSLTLPITNKNFISFIKRNANILTLSNKRIQSLLSSVCGQYVCTYIYYRSIGYSLDKFLMKFQNNVVKNDLKIDILFDKIFKKSRVQHGGESRNINISNSDVLNQCCTSYIG